MSEQPQFYNRFEEQIGAVSGTISKGFLLRKARFFTLSEAKVSKRRDSSFRSE